MDKLREVYVPQNINYHIAYLHMKNVCVRFEAQLTQIVHKKSFPNHSVIY